MRATGWAVGGTLGAVLLAAPAHALDPTQVFEKVSPSVWVVHSFEGKDRSSSLGSAVVIDTGRLVTNCHVIDKAKVVLVRRQNVMYEAKLEHADPARDLCLLKVANFTAPAVAQRSVKDLKVGERVYAIGNPQGLELTLSEGLVSGLRSRSDDPSSDTLVQTSAPISPGSSGGGLFDDEGRLVGITTFEFLGAQNLNVALPTDWIAMVPERAQAALAKRESGTANLSARAVNAAPGLPAPGTAWAYSFVERIFSRRPVEVTVRVVNVDDTIVEEAVTAPGARSVRRIVDAREPRFLEFPLSSSVAAIELAPYLVAINEGKTLDEARAPDGYPLGGAGLPGWNVSYTKAGWEQVKVPAGKFRAMRVNVAGLRSAPIGGRTTFAGRFEMTVWYAPDVKRIVRQEQKIWTSDGVSPTLYADEVLELTSYRPPS